MTDRKYGWIQSTPDWRDATYRRHRHPAIISRPPCFDLSPIFPPVYDQGKTGSCVGNGCVGIYQYNLIRQKFPVWMPSRLFAYWNARALEGSTASDCGAQVRDGIKGLVSPGVCSEEEWPFDIDKVTVSPAPHDFTAAASNMVTSYEALNQIMDLFCDTIAGGEPFVFGFACYTAFESKEVAKSGILGMPKSSEKLLGGHCVVGVGYDDAKRMLKFRNSWGKTWGQDGYGWMPYDYVANSDLAADFWVINTTTR